jgi:hypothetical protein
VQRSKAALKVEVPKRKDEPLKLGRVGIIAIVGFGAGVAWPHLAGVRLVPTLPNESGSSKEDLSGAPPEEKPSASSVASALPPPAEPEQRRAPNDQPPVVGEAQVTSCSNGGKRLKQCDDIDFDRVARAPIEALTGCQAAREISGVLSLGFELDFGTQRVTRVSSGKATTLDDTETSTLLECYRQAFAKVSLDGIPHEHQSYTVFYRVELKGSKTAPGASAVELEGEAAPVEVTPASGTATVTWNTALVRQSPNREGKTIARVLQGTRVGVTGRSGDWYRVKYDAKGNQGWVFRTAIGM